MTETGGQWVTVTIADAAPVDPGPTTKAAAKAVPLSWSLTAAAAGTAMLLAFVTITVFDGGPDAPAEAAASDPVTDQPLSSSTGNRSDPAADSSAEGETTSSVASAGSTEGGSTEGGSTEGGSTQGGSADASTPRSSPTTWAQEVAAAGPNQSIRLNPVASDWAAENIVIGKDLAGKFLGRVTVRYSGPGSARATFAVRLLKDGKEITTLTGELVEVRSGVYQVMLATAATWVEGPWTTDFRVISTT